jgi:ADP-heptose:LPS heptosyltransferase
MLNLVVSPFSQPLRNGNPNPKNFPYWEHVITTLKEKDIHITQIGRSNEPQIKNIDEFKGDLHFSQLAKLILENDMWISVDNFLPHFCNTIGKKGIVLFSKSDPKIFGYNQNINLLKDRKYLRSNQFGSWDEIQYDPDAFVSPSLVTNTVINWRK